jgi:WhiB family transcriptional regulator, redox-sensing transcriptional regulator
MAEALCAREVADHIWFPAKGASLQPARRICRRCPVREQCVQHAIADPSLRDGIWGGTTPKMRSRLRAAS